jgi:hypothetical protein
VESIIIHNINIILSKDTSIDELHISIRETFSLTAFVFLALAFFDEFDGAGTCDAFPDLLRAADKLLDF